MRKKKKIKYLLEFLTEELHAESVRAQLEMFKPTMIKQDNVLGDDLNEKLRNRLFSVSKQSFKAVSKESQYILALRDKLDKLHSFHLKCRLIAFNKFKEICLNFEFKEEEQFIEKYCKNIDVKLIGKHFKTKNRTCIEFKFNDEFFNEMVESSISEDKEQSANSEKNLEDYRLFLAFNKLSHDERINVINYVEGLIENLSLEKDEKGEIITDNKKTENIESEKSVKNESEENKPEEKNSKTVKQKAKSKVEDVEEIIPPDLQIDLFDRIVNS